MAILLDEQPVERVAGTEALWEAGFRAGFATRERGLRSAAAQIKTACRLVEALGLTGEERVAFLLGCGEGGGWWDAAQGHVAR